MSEQSIKLERQETYVGIRYSTELSSSRAKGWTVQASFTNDFRDRVADDSGRCAPSISVGKNSNRLKFLHEAKLPISLQEQMELFIEQVTAHEHTLALKAGQLPVARSVYDLYRNASVYSLPARDMSRANEILQQVCKEIPQTRSLLVLSAELALATIPRDEHVEVMAEYEQDLKLAKRALEDAESRVTELEAEAPKIAQRLEEFDSLGADLDGFIDRIKINDLIGAYGNTDMEKILDLLAPVMETLDSITA